MRDMRHDDVRRQRRQTLPNDATLHRPLYWNIDKAFDPYHIRQNAKAAVHAVNARLRDGTYVPYNPIGHEVPKKDGGSRLVSVFPLLDSLVSRQLYLSLMAKNRPLLSARSYAYRSDLSGHDAIQYIASEFNTGSRQYIAEFDFSKYFDTISHDYVDQILSEKGFLTTPQERDLIKSFLSAELQNPNTYSKQTNHRSQVGLPQGTSISLFLANVAAWELDRSLERIGVGFARYADDTLIWSREYSQISEAANLLSDASQKIGSKLNAEKSFGIRIFTPDGQRAEMEPTPTIEFIGYRFTRGHVGLSHKVEARVKARLQYLIWSNLLQPLQEKTFRAERVNPPVDRDYIVLIKQVRRYLYGNLNEKRVRQLQRGAVREIRYPGLMSYFPMVNDVDQLKRIDGWLLSNIHQAMNKRRMLLDDAGLHIPEPHGLERDQLLGLYGRSSDGNKVDLRIPSLVRINAIVYRAASTFGPNSIGRTGPTAYQYGG